MKQRIEVEILKVVNAGHFQSRPVGSRYESFMGQINDYFQCGKGAHSHAVIPQKGKMYVIKRTIDNCWYRARIQNVMTTMCGPQASVSLVDVGESTLVPYSVIRELPSEYESIPFQTMNCYLTGIKPLSMVTSYFDLTTAKQVCDHWSEAANSYVMSAIRGCKLIVHIQHGDEKGNYHVLLYAETALKEICVNDELVKQEYAVLSTIQSSQDESPSKTERRRVQQDNFQRKQQEIVNAFKTEANLCRPDEASSTDDEAYSTQSRSNRFPHSDYRSSLAILRQEVAGLRGSSTGAEAAAPLPNVTHEQRILQEPSSWPANQAYQLPGNRDSDKDSATHTTGLASNERGQGGSWPGNQAYQLPGTRDSDKDSAMHMTGLASNERGQGVSWPGNQEFQAIPHQYSSTGRDRVQSGSGIMNNEMGLPLPGRQEQHIPWPANQDDYRRRLGNSGVRGAQFFDGEAIESSPPTSSSSSLALRQDGACASTHNSTSNQANLARLQQTIRYSQRSEASTREEVSGKPCSSIEGIARSTLPTGYQGRETCVSSNAMEGEVRRPQRLGDRDGYPQGVQRRFSLSSVEGTPRSTLPLGFQRIETHGSMQGRTEASISQSLGAQGGQGRVHKQQQQFPLLSDEDSPGRVRFTSARLPATGTGNPLISSTQSIMNRLKPILKKDKAVPRQYSSSSSDTDGRLISDHIRSTNDERSGTLPRQIAGSSGEFNFAARTQPASLPSEMISGASQATNTSGMVYQDGVVIHGESAPRPFLSMDNSPFYEYGPRLGVSVPTPIQRHCWPALLRGRDVAGIGASSSGKTLAYLLPIIEQVLQTGAYQELPLTNGPLVLILCANWNNTAKVYEQCQQLLRARSRTRVQVIFGGGAEEDRVIPLINGCEILVATPPCFVRMLKRSYTTLDRLCHIVFDDADVLVEDFTAEVKEIMRLYGRLLKSQPGRLAPRQAVVMATRWTLGVASLVRAYLGNPLVIIADMIEACLFAGVKQCVTLCSSNQCLTELIGFLDNLEDVHEIVVFTFTTEEARKLGEFLRAHNHHVLVAHEFLQPHELADIKQQWNTPHSDDSVPVLVMTDGVVAGNLLSVLNASLVIHYDFPNKAKYNRRLRSIAQTYTSTKDHRCMSQIYLTEKTMREAMAAYKLMTRSKAMSQYSDLQDNNSLLEDVAKLAQQAKEEKKTHMDLCHFLMAYGSCRSLDDKQKCPMRHVPLQDIDFPHNVPTSGTVKILVLHVTRASNLWVRILEHRDSSSNLVPSTAYDSSHFLQLSMEMGLWYANDVNQVKVELPRISDLCALYQVGTYHRVKVCGIVRSVSQSGLPIEVEVQFVDQGAYACVKTEKLLQLPQVFRELPFQAVQVFVCRVKPHDHDQEWTHKANYIVRSMVEGKELEGKVVFSLNNTLWLDPLLERRVLKSINVTTNMNNIRLELLKQGLATENREHIKKLKILCADVIDLSIYDVTTPAQDPSDPSSSLETVVLDEDVFVEVYVTAIENPGLFFVQLSSVQQSLDDLEELINTGIPSAENDDEEGDIAIGSLCLARFTIDDKWYRARVLGMRADVEYDVFYVDHGEREWVSRDRIRPPWPEVLRLPLQAVECSLINISPLENDWTEQSSDAFYDMTTNKLLYAKVKSKVGSLVSGCHRFVVDLVDTSTVHDIVISQELVAIGHAQTSPEGIQTWFPEAIPFGQEAYTHEYEKIPEMCLQILKSRDHSQKLDIAKALQTIVMNSTSAKDAIRECGGVNCLCRLLLLTRAPAIQEHLLVSLDCVTFQNESNCEEARRAGALKTLCFLLEGSASVTVQEHVAWTLKNVSATERNKDRVRELGGIKILCNVLETATEHKLQEHVAWALEVLSSDNDRNCKAVHSCGGIKSLCQLVAGSTNQSVVERATRTLAALAPEPSNRNAIRQHGGLEAICRNVQENPDEEFLRVAIGALKALVNNNNHNRDVMRDLGMILTLQNTLLAPQKTSTITRRLCKDLLERLVGWAAAGMPLLISPTKTPPPPSPGTVPVPLLTSRHPPLITAPGGGVTRGGTRNVNEEEVDANIPPLVSDSRVSSQTRLPLVNGPLRVNTPPTANTILTEGSDNDMPPLEGPDEEEEITYNAMLPAPPSGSVKTKEARRKPRQKILAKPIDKSEDSGVEEGSDTSCVHPFTVWSQEKHVVRVAVRLRGAKKERVRAEFKETSLHFSTRMQGNNYHLDLQLFDNIIPEECEVHVKGAEILLLLKKSKSGEWTRLLKSKEKLPYISIDFDRWEVWSSSEEDDDKPKRELPKLRPKSPSSNKPQRVIVPEMDTSDSSSSETEEDFDENNEWMSFD